MSNGENRGMRRRRRKNPDEDVGFIHGIDEIRRAEEPFKHKARKRNIRSMLSLIILATLFAAIINAIISFIQMHVSRFDDLLIYSIVETIVFTLLYVAYAGVVILSMNKRVWPVHDTGIADNDIKQYGVIMIYCSILYAFLMFVVWIAYAFIDQNHDFDDMPGGAQYSGVMMIQWFICVFIIYALITAAFSFYRSAPLPYNKATTHGVYWSAYFGQIVEQKYDPKTNLTYLGVAADAENKSDVVQNQ